MRVMTELGLLREPETLSRKFSAICMKHKGFLVLSLMPPHQGQRLWRSPSILTERTQKTWMRAGAYVHDIGNSQKLGCWKNLGIGFVASRNSVEKHTPCVFSLLCIHRHMHM